MVLERGHRRYHSPSLPGVSVWIAQHRRGSLRVLSNIKWYISCIGEVWWNSIWSCFVVSYHLSHVCVVGGLLW